VSSVQNEICAKYRWREIIRISDVYRVSMMDKGKGGGGDIYKMRPT
jgi:hypothetical protein